VPPTPVVAALLEVPPAPSVPVALELAVTVALFDTATVEVTVPVTALVTLTVLVELDPTLLLVVVALIAACVLTLLVVIDDSVFEVTGPARSDPGCSVTLEHAKSVNALRPFPNDRIEMGMRLRLLGSCGASCDSRLVVAIRKTRS
ncbi:MAG TPA: hypothetical protein VFU02_23500, partial [Polyangiaceae bacterium]|nr:hypothetical protein [Polyangiaceae bacterium]